VLPPTTDAADEEQEAPRAPAPGDEAQELGGEREELIEEGEEGEEGEEEDEEEDEEEVTSRPRRPCMCTTALSSVHAREVIRSAHPFGAASVTAKRVI
jgi:hypothetical protein